MARSRTRPRAAASARGADVARAAWQRGDFGAGDRDLGAGERDLGVGDVDPGAGDPESGDLEAGDRRGSAGPPGDPEARAREICLRLLTAAPRTRAQLDDALRRRGVPQQAADAVLDRLTGVGLIDDAAFARAWVDTRHRGRGLARRALSAELRQRGVDEERVRAAVAELGPEQEAAAARRLVDAKLAATRGRPLEVRMRRLTGLLARKGYPPGMAYRVIREALEQEGLDPGDAGLEMEPVLDADTAMSEEPDLDPDAGASPDG